MTEIYIQLNTTEGSITEKKRRDLYKALHVLTFMEEFSGPLSISYSKCLRLQGQMENIHFYLKYKYKII